MADLTFRELSKKALFAAFFILILPGCNAKKKNDRMDQVKTVMEQFFRVPNASKTSTEGIWIADEKSVANIIEKKYLASYKAKPDEMQTAEIRERLKSLTIYFRVQGNNVVMLTFVADSFGLSTGELTRRPSGNVYDAVMKGKDNTLNAVFRFVKTATAENLEYEEGGLVITAVREQRPADELVRIYIEKIQSATGLVQY